MSIAAPLAAVFEAISVWTIDQVLDAVTKPVLEPGGASEVTSKLNEISSKLDAVQQHIDDATISSLIWPSVVNIKTYNADLADALSAKGNAYVAFGLRVTSLADIFANIEKELPTTISKRQMPT